MLFPQVNRPGNVLKALSSTIQTGLQIGIQDFIHLTLSFFHSAFLLNKYEKYSFHQVGRVLVIGSGYLSQEA